MNVCNKCGSDDLRVGITNIVSGATVYPLYCGQCDKVFAKYIKKNIAKEYQDKYGQLKYVKTSTAKYLESEGIVIECEVCGKGEAERHHWAPHFLFGDDAENWPTSLLCRDCHRTWHKAVTPQLFN